MNFFSGKNGKNGKNTGGLRRFKRKIKKCHPIAGSGVECKNDTPPPTTYLCSCQMLIGANFITQIVKM
jgi:hypothetical protein